MTLTKGFYMGETEVTKGQWRTFIRDRGYETEAEFRRRGAYVWSGGPQWKQIEGTYWDNCGFAQSDSYPVACVSWNDVQEFIKWLNKKEGVSQYRLPTEAEWEYTCRAGTQTSRFWGEDANNACSYANVADATEWGRISFGLGRHYCKDGYWFPAPVASFSPNPWGFYDMIGNVSEWCQDWSQKLMEKDYPSGSVTDPAGPLLGTGRVIRGGSWYYRARDSRSANRSSMAPDYRSDYLGFRLVRTQFDNLNAERKSNSQIKPVDSYIAVFDFDAPDKDKSIFGMLTVMIRNSLEMSDKYEVIDRDKMHKILYEKKFQMSDCFSKECQMEAGKILGVGKIVNCSMTLMGKTYYLKLQLIDVMSGKVELSAEDTCEYDEIPVSHRKLVKKLLSEKIE